MGDGVPIGVGGRALRWGLGALLLVALLSAGAWLAREPLLRSLHGTELETRLRLLKRRWVGMQRSAPVCAAERTLPPIDVVLIAVDTLRADHLGFLGYERATSPHLDALARDALVFEHAIAPAPWTTPSFAAVFTGVHPGALGIREPVPLPAEAVTLAEILCRAGWQTAGVVSHTYVGQRYGFDRGFAHWDESSAGGHAFVSSERVTDLAIRSLDRLAEAPAPFFLFVHYFDPHYDFQEHPDFPFSAGYTGSVRSEADNIGTLQQLAREGALDAADLQSLRDRYDSEIAFTDHHIGRLLGRLKQRGRYDGALVVFLADHGEGFAERPDRWIGHGVHLYDELVHVPLLLKLPARARIGRVTDPVSTADVPATVLDVLGNPAEAPGRSLLRPAPAPPPVFSQTWSRGTQRAVVEGRWKLIRRERSGRSELYDLRRDPGELQDVSRHHPDVVDRLERVLSEWREEQEALARRFSATERPLLSPEDRERLRGLGYAE
jgi:arylsulfatase A-like enzyme